MVTFGRSTWPGTIGSQTHNCLLSSGVIEGKAQTRPGQPCPSVSRFLALLALIKDLSTWGLLQAADEL